MSQRPSAFDLFLPGITGGLILAAIVIEIGDAMFPDAFRQLFPKQTFVALCLAIGATAALGLISLLCQSQENEEVPQRHVPSNDPKNRSGLTSGGNDVL